MQAEEKLDLLNKVDLFSETPHSFLQGISGVLEELKFGEGHEIIRKGDLDQELFILVDGQVKVHDGDLTIAHLDGLRVFGEYALLDTEPRSVSVTSTKPVTLWKLEQKDFYNTLESNPGVAQHIIATLVSRLRERTKEIIDEAKSREAVLEKQVEEKTEDLRRKNTELENTLKVLEQTRDQLVAKEKMASLGQLTAGIAHEIKNPLNFINNFSILSGELVDEINEDIISEKKEIVGEDLEELRDILKDLKSNSEKVAHHGNRADEIVQGMLMHSRKQSDDREVVSINRLLKEAMNLSFHGWRSKDSSFNAELITNIPTENIDVPVLRTEISRVFINIIDNAFYAMNEFHKKDGAKSVLDVSLLDEGDNVRILIKDNGPGIKKEVIDKLFEPFFTTKPTGSGTGLGLSLCYDIVVKAHSGALTVDSELGKGAVFNIVLPKQDGTT